MFYGRPAPWPCYNKTTFFFSSFCFTAALLCVEGGGRTGGNWSADPTNDSPDAFNSHGSFTSKNIKLRLGQMSTRVRKMRATSEMQSKKQPQLQRRRNFTVRRLSKVAAPLSLRLPRN